MRKFMSGVLSAAILAGMFSAGGVVAAAEDKALKFDDTVLKEAGGMHGYAVVDVADENQPDPDLTAISMDFTFGHAAPCIHPTDKTLYHSSKFNMTIGETNGKRKYFGYNATEDFFYLARSGIGPNGGESLDGYDYLVTGGEGIVHPGETHKVVFYMAGDFDFRVYVDGQEIIKFDLFEDMDYADCLNYADYYIIYPTHICCFIDNLAIYNSKSNFDPETGSGTPCDITDFNDAKEESFGGGTDDEGNEVSSSEYVSAGNWTFGNSTERAYYVAVIEDSVYGQPQTPAEEGQPNIIFENNVESTSGREFEAALTMKNNPGFTSLSLDLMNDPYITVTEVEAASGLTATLGEADSIGVRKLTLTASQSYTGTALATIKYTMATEAVQDFSYGYGAKASTVTGVENVRVTIGMTEVYNYTVGDPDGDGRCTTSDVVIASRLAARWEIPGVFAESCDLNGDGRTNSMDVTHMLRAIAGWKEYKINLG